MKHRNKKTTKTHTHETHTLQQESDEPENGADTRYGDRFQNFLGEVKMLRELNHPNICLLMGTCFVQGAKVQRTGRSWFSWVSQFLMIFSLSNSLICVDDCVR